MMMKESLFLLLSNVLVESREVWGREGPTNDGEGLSVSVNFKCFRKGAH